MSCPKDTSVGSGGSTSASRQSYMTGGAVRRPARKSASAVRAGQGRLGRTDADLPLSGGELVSAAAACWRAWPTLLRRARPEVTVDWRHRPHYPLDPETGQGDAHVQYAFAAHRAVVDVDTELGLVKVVELACAQDVGRAMNPQAVEGQIHGGTAQGLGLALMEEIQVTGGQGAEPLVHRLPDPHHPGHAADAGRRARARRPARALRAARGRRTAHDLLHAGHRRRDPRGDRPGPDPDPGPARAHHRHVMTDAAGAGPDLTFWADLVLSGGGGRVPAQILITGGKISAVGPPDDDRGFAGRSCAGSRMRC